MELLERYLQAVRFWLPKAHQQDIIAELSEDLHSQIEDKAIELARPLNPAEVEAILKKCGSPILVASRYRPQTQLIGPALFPIYWFVLKIVLFWILIPVFLVIVGPAMVLSASDRIGALLEVLSTLWSAMFISAGIITLIFAGLERTQAKLHLFEKWDLRTLPPLGKKDQPPSRTHSIFEIVFSIIGLLWLLAVPHYLFLILGPASTFLKPAPMWHSFYLPMIFLSVMQLTYQVVSLLRPQWEWFPPAARLLTTVLTIVVLNLIVSAANAPGADWHRFIVLSETVRNSNQTNHVDLSHLNRIVAIVNVSVLLSLLGTWLGFCVAGVIQTWELMRRLRKRTSHTCGAALMRLL
jgi:hypothetical protein